MPVGFVTALDHEARGVLRAAGKAVFVEGALPGETVEYASFRAKARYEQAYLTRIVRAAVTRVAPCCPHFGICGGCVMQHLDVSAQVAVKQRILEDSLWRIGRVRAEEILPPIYGHSWGYRRKARLAVRYVPKKGGVLVGFHEKRSSYIADIQSCAVLHPAVSALLLPLRALVGALSVAERLPQVEVAVGDECVALSLRILAALTPTDEEKLMRFADRHGVVFYLQPGGPETVFQFYPEGKPALAYHLPEFALAMSFSPTDFTQVNHGVNQVLARRAMVLLDPQPGERIADLFCGLGNFTLPLARHGARVVGVEGSRSLVSRARNNAAVNGLDETRARFVAGNLFLPPADFWQAMAASPEKALIDPPREGALEIIKLLPDTHQGLASAEENLAHAGGETRLERVRPGRILYISCNPATLARDAGILAHQKGYRLAAAGIVNMFPHTAHVESLALFTAL
jgi:23S rRNA (uracil1939-C5)-methyltransferase